MATFLGQTYIPQKQRTDSNFPLLAQIMQMKQQKYDVNRAKVQETLDSFGMMGQHVLRDQDKDYIAAKLTDITTKINNYGSMDLSQSGAALELESMIKSAARDPLIQSAIQETQKYNKFQTDVALLKEKHPEKYSDLNYRYALEQSGLKDYMDGKANKIGNLTYTPYVDVNKKLIDNLKDVSTIKKGKRVVQIRDVDGSLSGVPGTLINKEIEGLSQKELEVLIPGMIDGNMRAQLSIDGHYRFNGDKEAALAVYKQAYGLDTEEIDTTIKNLQTDIESGKLSADKLNATTQRIEQLEKLKESKKEVYDNMAEQSVSYIGGYLEEQSLVNRLSQTLYAEESVTYLKDGAYFANLEAKAKATEAMMQARPSVATVPGVTGLEETPLEDDFDFIKDEGMKLGSTLTATTDQLFNNLTEDQKAKVNAKMKDGKFATYPDSFKKIEAMREAGVLDADQEGALNRAYRQYKSYLEDDAEYYKKATNIAFLGEGMWDNLTDDYWLGNAGIKIFDEKAGKNVNYKQYLEARGIKSKKDYQNFIENNEASKEFKAKFLSDLVLSSTIGNKSQFIEGGNNLGKGLRDGSQIYNISEDMLLNFDRLASVLGENVQFTDVFDVYATEVNVSGSYMAGRPVTIDRPVDMEYINRHKGDDIESYRVAFKKGVDSKTKKIIQDSLAKGTFDTTVFGFGRDNSVQDDPTYRRNFSVDNFKEEYGRASRAGGVRYIKGYNNVIITPSTGEKNKIAEFEDLKSTIAAGQAITGDEDTTLRKIEIGVGVSISRDPNQEGMFIVKQGDKMIGVSETALARTAPNLYSKVNFADTEQQVIRRGAEKPITVTNINYRPSDSKNNLSLGNRYGLGSDAYLAATREGAKELLRKDDKSKGYLRDATVSETLNKALNSTDKFKVELKNYQGQDYVDVYFDGIKIADIPAFGAERQSLEDLIDYDPQIFVTSALRSILIELHNNNNENFKKLYGRLQ